jgi:hypothetical protein
LQYDGDADSIWVLVDSTTVTVKARKLTYPHVDSLAPGEDSITYAEYTGGATPDSVDSLIRKPKCKWLHEIRPDWCQFWHIGSWRDRNGSEKLDSCDIIDVAKLEDISWWHVIRVERVIETPDTVYWLAVEPRDGNPADTMVLTYEESIFPDEFIPLDSLLLDPRSTVWHEKYPNLCTLWHIGSWDDTNESGELDSCDIIDMAKLRAVEFWHVRDVGIDILVFSIPSPDVPTLTQWGVIVLVALLISSAIFIMLRKRRRATMHA